MELGAASARFKTAASASGNGNGVCVCVCGCLDCCNSQKKFLPFNLSCGLSEIGWLRQTDGLPGSSLVFFTVSAVVAVSLS